MTWQGIRQDTDYTALDGPLNAINARFYYDGELRRRLGMQRSSRPATVAGVGVAAFRAPGTRTQFAIHLSSAGALEAVTL